MEYVVVEENLDDIQFVKERFAVGEAAKNSSAGLKGRKFDEISNAEYTQYLTNREKLRHLISKKEAGTSPAKSLQETLKQTITSTHFDFNDFGTELIDYIVKADSYELLNHVLTTSLEVIPDQDICHLLIFIGTSEQLSTSTESIEQLSLKVAELQGILEILKGSSSAESDSIVSTAFRVYLLFLIFRNPISDMTIKQTLKTADANCLYTIAQLVYILFEVLSLFVDIGEEQGQKENLVSFTNSLIDVITQKGGSVTMYQAVLNKLAEHCTVGIYEEENASQIENLLQAYDQLNFKKLAKATSKRSSKKIKYDEFTF